MFATIVEPNGKPLMEIPETYLKRS